MNEKQKRNLWKNINVNKLIRKILLILLVAIVIVLGIYFFLYNDEEEVTEDYLGTKLSKVGELTTVKLNYTGFLQYQDKGIPIFNRSDFIMTYEANARVGIDLEKVEIEVDNTNKMVSLTIPKAEIQDVKIDTSEIKYYDSDFALFNVDEKEDGNKALELAEKYAQEELGKMGVLESAVEHALTLIKGLLQNAVPADYEFKGQLKNES